LWLVRALPVGGLRGVGGLRAGLFGLGSLILSLILGGEVAGELLEHLPLLRGRVLEDLFGLLAETLGVLAVLLALLGVLGELLEFFGEALDGLGGHSFSGVLGRLL